MYLILVFAGEILFDNTFPDEPPDFIFGPDEEDFLPNLENIKVIIIFLSLFKNGSCLFFFSL